MFSSAGSILSIVVKKTPKQSSSSWRSFSTNSKNDGSTLHSISRPSLQAPRGMHDCFGLEQQKRQFIVDTCKKVASIYGFEEISTPLVEEESVFSRTLGSDSDVVSKEMYTFPDRSNHMLSLRPEGTAGVVRAAINHKHLLGNRLFYTGPMFRYERPQKGRARQV
jgi:histidyl-tRNA synthetase